MASYKRESKDVISIYELNEYLKVNYNLCKR